MDRTDERLTGDAATLRKHAGMLQALAMLAKAMGQHKIYALDMGLAEQMIADLNRVAQDLTAPPMEASEARWADDRRQAFAPEPPLRLHLAEDKG